MNKCDVCGRTGTRREVNEKGDIWEWNIEKGDHWDPTSTKDTLCLSCWNKVRRLVRKEREYHEIRSLIAKLNREILKNGKNQNNR